MIRSSLFTLHSVCRRSRIVNAWLYRATTYSITLVSYFRLYSMLPTKSRQRRSFAIAIMNRHPVPFGHLSNKKKGFFLCVPLNRVTTVQYIVFDHVPVPSNS